MISLVLREGRLVCILFLLPTFIFCYSRYSDVIYERISGHRLHGYVMKAIPDTDVIDCSVQCLSVTGCQSYNYKHKPQRQCEMNNKTKHNLSVAFQANQDYSYYEIQCPCLNGGSCMLDVSSTDFRCTCTTNYQGSFCENHIPLGSQFSNPGKSCKHIKDLVAGVTDGPQWIDPENSGMPFKVHCDMTTDYGGWTMVSNYIIPSSGSIPNLYVATSFPAIASYANNCTVISSTALRTLQEATSFAQLRFYCRKATVGRTVHIITALNATGLAVVNYFTSFSKPRPKSCGSFYVGPDDTSILSKSCLKWGPPKYGCDEWGNSLTSENKVHDHPFFIYGGHHFLVRTSINRVECDDFNQGLSAGDFWKIYVR